MKIVQMLWQHRRDFKAKYQCESCKHEQERSGYDDRHFHDTVIPDMKCEKCGKSRNDLGIVGEYTATKYSEGFQN